MVDVPEYQASLNDLADKPVRHQKLHDWLPGSMELWTRVFHNHRSVRETVEDLCKAMPLKPKAEIEAVVAAAVAMLANSGKPASARDSDSGRS